MATPRLTFLYPTFMRSLKPCEPATRQTIPRRRPSSRTNGAAKAGFHCAPPTRQEAFSQTRYGTANDPKLPPPSRPKDDSKYPPNPSKEATSSTKERESSPQERSPPADNNTIRNADTSPDRPPPPPPPPSSSSASSSSSPSTPPAPSAASTPEQQSQSPSPSKDASSEEKTSEPAHQEAPKSEQTPLDTVLAMPAPKNIKPKPPHLAPPPYVHHFDTYTLVRNLEKGGFTQDQAVTIMKAVRSLIAVNLDIANESLVSKSDVENETYLFRAACSELKTALHTSRTAEIQKQRSQRAHLAHESDLVNQRMNQELMGLKEDLKGMLSDRKMAVQMEQRNMTSTIQELNYKITVLLNSDSRSEVEGLRWVLTRRAAIAIGISVVMVLSTLKYSSYVMHEEEERLKREKEREALAKSSAAGLSSSSTQPPAKETVGLQT